MEVTTKQLVTEPERIIFQAASGQEITVTYMGQPCVKIVPIMGTKSFISSEMGN